MQEQNDRRREMAVRPAAADRARAPRRSGFAFGLLGFLIGIVFWHTVGFWRIVTNAIEPAAEQERNGEAVRPQQDGSARRNARVAGDLTVLTAIDPGACTALVLNRTTGLTVQGTCDATPMPTRATRPSSRADIALMPVRRTSGADAWMTSVEAREDGPDGD